MMASPQSPSQLPVDREMVSALTTAQNKCVNYLSYMKCVRPNFKLDVAFPVQPKVPQAGEKVLKDYC